MNKLKLASFIVTVACIGLSIGPVVSEVNAGGCGGWFQPDCNSASGLQQGEQQRVTDNQIKMEKAEPIPQLQDSLERSNIKKRLEAYNNPNKISYIYLVSFGRVMSFYTIKGKVTSGSKRLTSTERFVQCDQGEYDGECQTESPELDGTYGNSTSYIYFWTTDNVYVQWSGDYMLVDQPLKLATTPDLTREVQ